MTLVCQGFVSVVELEPCPLAQHVTRSFKLNPRLLSLGSRRNMTVLGSAF